MQAVVVALGQVEVDDALAQVARLGTLGLGAVVVQGPPPAEVRHELLSSSGRRVDPSWLGPDGRTLTAAQAARVLGHDAAWRHAAEQAEPTLVVDATAVLADDLVQTVRSVVDELGSWEILHLDDERDGTAYVLTRDAAAALADDLPSAIVPLGAVLAGLELDGYSVSPPLAAPARRVLADHVLTDHLVVVEADDVLARAASLAGEVDDGCVALVLPAGRHRVLGTPAEVLAAFARAGAGRLHRPGPVVMGPVAGLAEPAPAPDDVAALHHHLGGDGTLVLAGRLLDVVAGVQPAVVTADDPALLASLDAELADAGHRDLVRLLRYDGAADLASAAGLREVAPELVVVPWWTPEMCATVVRAAEAVGAFQPDADDPVPGHEISLAAISPRLFAHLEDDIAVRLMPLLHERWPFVDYHGLRDAFVIKYAPGQQEELRIHHDVAQLSASLRLNDGYTGAELEFPRQGWSNGDVPVGHLVVWPSLVTHPHRATPLRTGVKYGLTIWFELPG